MRAHVGAISRRRLNVVRRDEDEVDGSTSRYLIKTSPVLSML